MLADMKIIFRQIIVLFFGAKIQNGGVNLLRKGEEWFKMENEKNGRILYVRR